MVVHYVMARHNIDHETYHKIQSDIDYTMTLGRRNFNLVKTVSACSAVCSVFCSPICLSVSRMYGIACIVLCFFGPGSVNLSLCLQALPYPFQSLPILPS